MDVVAARAGSMLWTTGSLGLSRLVVPPAIFFFPFVSAALTRGRLESPPKRS